MVGRGPWRRRRDLDGGRHCRLLDSSSTR
jgi:hypothetical protein